MIRIEKKSDCCGCEACIQRCPKNCLSLKIDNEGFAYPSIDSEVCIDCGLCEKVCPILNPFNKLQPIKVFAAINIDEKIRIESSYGGLFTLLAEKIIDEGGVVFGAFYNSDWQIEIGYEETKNDLKKFRGSKYVQARVGNSYQQCLSFLVSGRKVLFSGTPCQVAGLKHFLRKDYENLLTVDFACHGVPSPGVWGKYIYEEYGAQNIVNISMRDKSKGWKNFRFEVTYRVNGDTKVLSSHHKDNPYMSAFLHDLILRPSCYDCKVKECRSNADITIADFWGISIFNKNMDDDKGTSLVLVNTSNGLSSIHYNQMQYVTTTYENGCRVNPALYKSAKPWPKRDYFFENLEEIRFEDLVKRTLKTNVNMMIHNCYSNTLFFVRRAIKRFIKIISV